MSAGADLEVLNQFLTRTLDSGQLRLLEQLQESLAEWDIHGQKVAVGSAVASSYVDSASVLTHYVVEDMGFRVAIAVIAMPERLQIVARSRVAEVDVGAIMARLGGGGHAQAASAGFRDLSVEEALSRVRAALEAEVRPPLKACDIMSTPVRSVAPTATMSQVGELMARWGHSGIPVVEGDTPLGMVTRKDVDKALRHGLAHAPVTGFMGRSVLGVSPQIDLTELERLLATRGIGRVPVTENGAIVGIVTRKDLLRAEHGDAYLDRGLVLAHPEATQRFLDSLETVLPAEALDTIRALGTIAAERGERAHLVGGFVRDMVLGRANLDIDVVVEGDAIPFAEAASVILNARVKVHRRFGTAVIVLSKDVHVDVASSRSEYYARPGALPTVERSNLRQDLLRRDFTINAMAACIDPDCFGRLADPYAGLSDLDRRTVRVLHALSFVDDPTRILRAARFEERYGFRMDQRTEDLARQAARMGLLEEVSGARLREELLDILDELDPLSVLARLSELGALNSLLPEGSRVRDDLDVLHGSVQAIEVLSPLLNAPPERGATILVALTMGAERGAVERWLRHYRIGRAHAQPALVYAQRHPQTLAMLEDPTDLRPSRLYRLLEPWPSEALAVLWGAATCAGRERVEYFARELSHVRPAVSGSDLIALGYQPTEAFTSILAHALDDRLDGRATGRDAELANLRQLAKRAHLKRIPSEGAS
jgi:tRNA nucleotidyltransferase (CCA-adding enzyme)